MTADENFLDGRSIRSCVCPCSLRRPGKLSRCSDLLRTGQSGNRNPVWGDISAPVETGLRARATLV
jgi:hypothetical protein